MNKVTTAHLLGFTEAELQSMVQSARLQLHCKMLFGNPLNKTEMNTLKKVTKLENHIMGNELRHIMGITQ